MGGQIIQWAQVPGLIMYGCIISGHEFIGAADESGIHELSDLVFAIQ